MNELHEIDVLTASGGLHAEAPWAWPIPVYLFLGGLTAGLMVINGLGILRDPEGTRSSAWRHFPMIAPLLLSLGMGALFLDISHKVYVWRFYFAFEVASPMSWGSWILLLVYPSVLLLALAEPVDFLAGRIARLGPEGRLARSLQTLRATPWKRRLALVNVLLGVALGVYTGILLSTTQARPLWSSAILGPLFLASGLSAGAALMLLFRLGETERHEIHRLDVGLVAVEILLLALFLLGLATGGEASARAVGLLLGGPYTAAFFGLVVFGGLLVPLVAGITQLFGRVRVGRLALVPVLVLIGSLSLRWILVSAGQDAGWGAL
jgi:formate-dependent nitrite reductase membrane component NrfD